MDNKNYTITLADGTVLKNLTLNGNNYFSNDVIDEKIFTESALKKITISNGSKDEVHENVKLMNYFTEPVGCRFIIAEKSADELEKEKLYADLADAQGAVAELTTLLTSTMAS